MTQLVWTDSSAFNVTVGVDRGVFYTPEGFGVAWNGLTSVDILNDTHETRSYFLEGQPVRKDVTSGDFSAAITAYIYPDALDEYSHDGFGLSYRTRVIDEDSEHYQLHILYNLQANPKDSSYTTLMPSVDITMFGWEVSSLPSRVDGLRAMTHLVIDSKTAYPWLLKALERQLYGSDETSPRLPILEELLSLFEESSILRVTDHGDGTFTIEGPDDSVYLTGIDTWEVDASSAIYIEPHTYTVSSL